VNGFNISLVSISAEWFKSIVLNEISPGAIPLDSPFIVMFPLRSELLDILIIVWLLTIVQFYCILFM
jgi:hypothetical protein